MSPAKRTPSEGRRNASSARDGNQGDAGPHSSQRDAKSRQLSGPSCSHETDTGAAGSGGSGKAREGRVRGRALQPGGAAAPLSGTTDVMTRAPKVSVRAAKWRGCRAQSQQQSSCTGAGAHPTPSDSDPTRVEWRIALLRIVVLRSEQETRGRRSKRSSESTGMCCAPLGFGRRRSPRSLSSRRVPKSCACSGPPSVLRRRRRGGGYVANLRVRRSR